ncbi:MAG: protein kinase domain-containing protein [Acidobacteriota bacterium]
MSKIISPNSTIAQYTIVSKIGEGGMGEVWRARDPKLGRDVAIKVLPALLSENADRLNRFEQEAQAAGALNHPNILVIYHIGTHEAAPYIVSELLEGETLRERMTGGALPQRKAIDYGLQIAKGLAAAHEKGIVHRDIKPDNVFVTNDGRVKILDFGLAKLTGVSETQSQTEVPTRKVNTDPGTVMGTMGYMSPEQLKGQHGDHRSDIFSFGAILYEMLSGKRAFRGDSMAETMSAILREDPPDLSETNHVVSPALERVVRHCLEKNPAERFHSARDLAFAIESLSGGTIISGPTSLSLSNIEATEKRADILRFFRAAPVAWIIAAVCIIGLLTILAVLYFNRANPDVHVTRLTFTPPTELAFNDMLPDAAVISPDGQKIAFSATSADGKNMLYVRTLDATEAKVLPGSENPLEPFWSPDSGSIAFGSNGKLKRSDLAGGNAQVLCDAARIVGGSWSKDGVIVFIPDYRTALVQVSAQGGEPKPVAMKTEDADERHRHPYFLPDGRHFLFLREHQDTGNKDIWVGSLDSPEIKQILPGDSPVVYAPQGYLIFVRNDALVAQAFDAAKLALAGDAMPIITGQANELGTRRFSVSHNGVLIWQGKWQREYQLVWFDREGKQTGTIDAPMKVSVTQDPHISPDGKRLVVKRDFNLWVFDLEKGTGLRITSTFSQIPVWSPDGSRLAYTAVGGLTMKAANGSGEAETLVPGANFPADWSPDGRFIIFLRRGVKTRRDMWALPMSGDRKEYLLLNSPFDEHSPHFSPDGRWLAYASDVTGNYEVYVQSFSADGKLGADKKRVSAAGGILPVWRRDGSELFFVAADGQMMASSVKTGGPEFEFAAPKPLFKTRMMAPVLNFHEYDVSPDGQRFLIGTLVGDTKAVPPTVIMNWTSLLNK